VGKHAAPLELMAGGKEITSHSAMSPCDHSAPALSRQNGLHLISVGWKRISKG